MLVQRATYTSGCVVGDHAFVNVMPHSNLKLEVEVEWTRRHVEKRFPISLQFANEYSTRPES